MKLRKISNLALFVDVSRPEALGAAAVIAELVRSRGAALQIPREQSTQLKLDGAVSAAFPRSADVLVSLGGDGTLLQAAHLAAPLGIPVMGVDFGRMGFLTAASRADYESVIYRMLSEGVQTESRIALEAYVAGQEQRYFAVNDIHIDRKHQGHIVSFGIDIGDEPVADIPADGIVVASPTGSTAYFLSAGGPILAPRLDAFGIAPICPHTLFSRPLVVGAAENVRISISAESGGAQLYADGKLQVDLAPGSAVNVVKAQRSVDFVRVDERQFFEVLERKLHWGASIKHPR
jgi:NAD+ kinase